MKYLELRKKIIEICLWLQEKDLVVGTWGNVSVRVEDGILLTPSRIAYDVLQPEDFVVIDYDGNKIDGFRSPTTEREVHRLIYLARPDLERLFISIYTPIGNMCTQENQYSILKK